MTSCFRSALGAEQKEKYKALTTDAERRAIVARFVCDPDDFRGTVTSSCSVFNANHDKEKGGWYMESQLAGPRFFNDAAIVKALIEGKDLVPRPDINEFASLRAKGIPQYWLSEHLFEKITGQKDKTTVKAEGSLTSEEFNQVSNEMRGAPSF